MSLTPQIPTTQAFTAAASFCLKTALQFCKLSCLLYYLVSFTTNKHFK